MLWLGDYNYDGYYATIGFIEWNAVIFTKCTAHHLSCNSFVWKKCYQNFVFLNFYFIALIYWLSVA